MKLANFQLSGKAVAILVGASVIGACAIAPAIAGPNLLTNGNFEANGTGNFTGGVPGWTSGPGTFTHIGVISTPGIDKYAVLNHGGKDLGINQLFDVIKGTQYTLSYDFGTSRKSDIAENQLQVDISPLGKDPVFSTTNSMVGPGAGQLWDTFTYTFTAAKSGVDDILFKSVGQVNPPFDTVFVDNISIEAVPEVGTLVLFGLLLVGGLVILRRRPLAVA